MVKKVDGSVNQSADGEEKDSIRNAISSIEQSITSLQNLAPFISDDDRFEINALSKKLHALQSKPQAQSLSTAGQHPFLVERPTSHFEELEIIEYRKLKSLKLSNLARINLIAGINNSGKTTILEAIKLMCALNAPNEFIKLIQLRSKISSDQVDMKWLIGQLPSAKLSGRFDDRKLTLDLKLEKKSITDINAYLISSCFDTSYDEKKWSSQIHFFKRSAPKTEGDVTSLCPSVFSNPFSGLDPDLLKMCHKKSIKDGSKQQIVNFIQKFIDPSIQNIELVENEQFAVEHDLFFPNPDLTMFGEGLQRIFKIGLLFACAKNGVVIIDEFENAIHTMLLPKIVALIYELAVQFNVQVFLTSHSKECIDAFVNSDRLQEKDLAAYTLVSRNNLFECFHFSGSRMKRLIGSIDFDLRGKYQE